MFFTRVIGSVVAASLLFVGGNSFADTIYVPDDYETIQGAIDAALNGDEVVVADGTWSGPGNKDLDFRGKAIVVRSESREAALCIIDCEDSGRGFDLHRGETSEARIEGFTVVNGHAEEGGGLRTDGSPSILRCIFMNNTAVTAGGGIHVSSGRGPTIVGCVFIGNTTGGVGGGVSVGNLASASVINCSIIGNESGWGGGLGGGSFVIVGCVLNGNQASSAGGGILAFGVTANSIVWGNRAGSDYGEIGTNYHVVVHSDVRGGFPGDGNIDADPAFATALTGTWSAAATYDPGAHETTFFDEAASFVPGELFARSLIPNILAETNRGAIIGNSATEIRVKGNLTFLGTEGARYEIQDFHLSAGSPCIDAGDNSSVPDWVVDDLHGNPRFVDDPLTKDTGRGDPPIVDMGSYEFQVDLCPADLDGSGAVDFGDILEILTAWGPCEGGCPEDLDDSGAVDFGDILAVLTAWGPCE